MKDDRDYTLCQECAEEYDSRAPINAAPPSAELTYAYSPDNTYPCAILAWVGPGWYAACCTHETCRIERIGTGSVPPSTWGSGYGTPAWATCQHEALGNYRPEVAAVHLSANGGHL